MDSPRPRATDPDSHTAILLAAGTGSRLRDVLGRWPKTMAEVGGSTFFARIVERLRSAGVERLVVVGGYRWGVFKPALKDLWPDAELLVNEAYETTGSMRSLAVAVPSCPNGAIVLESDLIFESRAVGAVQRSDHDDVVLVSGPTDAGDEVWVCGPDGPEPDRGPVREISKEPSGSWPRQGELVGISRLSGTTLAAMAASHREDGEGARMEHYEERIAAVTPERDVRWLRVDDLLWAEADTPDQLARAEREILPAIEARERDGT